MRVLWRRGRALIAVVVVAGAVGLVWSRGQTPQYRATAVVAVKPSATAALLDPNAASAANDPTASAAGVVNSAPVKNAVQAQLGTAPTVTVTPDGTAGRIDIAARSSQPAMAAALANAYANAFVHYSQTQDHNATVAAEAQLQGQISALQNEIDSLDQPNQAPAVSSQVAGLTEQQAILQQQLHQLERQTPAASGGVQLLSRATVPTRAVSPSPVRDLVVTLAIGVLLGAGVAYGWEWRDRPRPSDGALDGALDAVLAGLPPLGAIPKAAGSTTSAGPFPMVSDPASASPLAQAYRALGISLQARSDERPLRTVVVTSPSAGDGKTTVVANLGVALAQAGQRVVVADCDLRRPRLHQQFGLSRAYGFTSVLRGEMPVFSALQAVRGLPNLRVLAAGPLPAHPAPILASARAAEVLAALRGQADIVLVDSPAILTAIDAAVLGRRVDGVVMVVRVGSTTAQQTRQALGVMADGATPIIGTVCNGVTSARASRDLAGTAR